MQVYPAWKYFHPEFGFLYCFDFIHSLTKFYVSLKHTVLFIDLQINKSRIVYTGVDKGRFTVVIQINGTVINK